MEREQKEKEQAAKQAIKDKERKKKEIKAAEKCITKALKDFDKHVFELKDLLESASIDNTLTLTSAQKIIEPLSWEPVENIINSYKNQLPVSKWNFKIQTQIDNYNEEVLVAGIRTKCDASFPKEERFAYVININFNKVGYFHSFIVWVENPPKDMPNLKESNYPEQYRKDLLFGPK